MGKVNHLKKKRGRFCFIVGKRFTGEIGRGEEGCIHKMGPSYLKF